MVTDGGMHRYRCRVGHAWSPETLASEQAQALERALWTALRGLEERAALDQHMGERAEERRHGHSADRFRQRSAEAHEAAELLRGLLHRRELTGAPPPGEVEDS